MKKITQKQTSADTNEFRCFSRNCASFDIWEPGVARTMNKNEIEKLIKKSTK